MFKATQNPRWPPYLKKYHNSDIFSPYWDEIGHDGSLEQTQHILNANQKFELTSTANFKKCNHFAIFTCTKMKTSIIVVSLINICMLYKYIVYEFVNTL